MEELAYKYLKVINFKQLTKWYVELYLNESTIKSQHELVCLKDLITPESRLIKKNDYDNKTPIIEKIVFKDGKVKFRNECKTSMNLYLSKKDELIVSKINFHQGAVAINTFGDIVCTTHYQPYKINSNKILPEYLILILRSNYFLNIVNGVKAQGIKNESGYNFIGDFEIPLPNKKTQQILVDNYNKTMEESSLNNINAEKLYMSIDNALFEELGINSVKLLNCNERKKLHLTSFKNLISWSVDINIAPVSPKDMFLSNKYNNICLSNVADINPRTQFFNKKNDDIEVTFLPMNCISDVYGEIKDTQVGTVKNSKGYTKFKKDDVLWAKITPCMQNGKCAIASNLKNDYGYGSTEYHVIRVNEKKLLNKYIYCILRTRTIREIAQHYFTGSAGQQRVRSEFLENLVIPLPSLDIQNSIVDKIFLINDEIKKYRKKTIALAESAKLQFEKSVFIK